MIIACAAPCFAIVSWIMPRPKLHPKLIVPKPSVNIGEVLQLDKGRETWALSNAGVAPLLISLEDISDCGCPVLAIDEVRVRRDFCSERALQG